MSTSRTATILSLGAAAALGTALGVAAERLVVGRSVSGGEASLEEFGSIRSAGIAVTTDDGAVLHVEVDEAGAAADDLTIIFTHGYCLNLDTWHYQRRDLAGVARLVFWDQRGHGRSTRSEQRYAEDTIDRLGRDLAAVIESVAPTGPIMLVGHSMGGMTTMAFAGQFPELVSDRVLGVTLMGTSAFGLGDVLGGLPAPLARVLHRVVPPVAAGVARREQLVNRTRETASDLGLAVTRAYSFGSDVPAELTSFTAAMLTATPLDVAADFLPTFAAHDDRDSLAAFADCDVLILVGDDDRLTPPSHSVAIAQLIPGSLLIVLPHTGHMLMLERHQEVSAQLTAQVERIRAVAASGGRR